MHTEKHIWYKPHVTGTVPRPRNHHTAAPLQVDGKSKIYFFAGWNGRGYMEDLDVLDIGNASLGVRASLLVLQYCVNNLPKQSRQRLRIWASIATLKIFMTSHFGLKISPSTHIKSSSRLAAVIFTKCS